MSRFELFTDGACQPNPGAGGWAFAIRGSRNDVPIELVASGFEKNTTNNRMELEAVRSGFKYFAEKIWQDGDQIVLVSDSKYLINGIESWCENWAKRGWIKADDKPVLNKDLWEDILALKHMIKPTCQHVRGHTGHEMNELVDKLAVQAAQKAKR